ncbi:MAG: helix-hairpin-helix domain-containing protein [Haloferacaceae archaeon]
MSILDRLLSALGVGGDEAPDDRQATVTVEHAPDAGDEAAVKGVDLGASATDAGAGDAGAADGPAADAADADGTEGAAADAADADPVETVKGIGPAYGDRLESAGIETVADLAAADAADLAERTSLSETRLSRWIERARARR